MKLISYLIQNPNKVKDFSEKEFQHPLTNDIFKAIHFLKENNHNIVLDEIHIYVKKFNANFEYSELTNIVESFQDFSNYRFLKKQLKDNYIRYVDNKNILSDVAQIYSSSEDLTKEKLNVLKNKIEKNIFMLEGEDLDFSIKSSVSRYNSLLEERSKGEKKRTIGVPILDNMIGKRLGKKGSMLTLFGLSGSSKSTFTLYITNCLINNPRKICVLYFTLENTEEDVMDMLVSMRTSIPTERLETPDDLVNSELEKINKELQKISNLENFHIYDESSLSIDKLESKILQSKEIFRESGILPDDGYCVVIIDLATMITDFEELDARKMEQVVNRLHRLTRKENLFLINVVQANENDLRGGKRFENIDQIKKYRLLRENIKHGASFFERSRIVLSLKRTKDLVQTYFPEDKEEWETMPDIIQCHIIKNNKGKKGLVEFGFEPESLQIAPIVKEN